MQHEMETIAVVSALCPALTLAGAGAGLKAGREDARWLAPLPLCGATWHQPKSSLKVASISLIAALMVCAVMAGYH